MKKLLLTISWILAVCTVYGQDNSLLAFPEAVGWGAKVGDTINYGGLTKYAITGNPADTTTIVEVSNCNDSGPGSLRSALQQGERLTVIINVDCKGMMLKNIRLDHPYVTIYKAKTGGSGFILVGKTIQLRNNFQILRGLTVYNNANGDAYEIIPKGQRGSTVKGIIIDQSTGGYAGDEVFGSHANRNDNTRWVRNVSLQRNIIYNPLPPGYKGSLLPNGTNDVSKVSLDQNAYLFCWQRTPKASGDDHQNDSTQWPPDKVTLAHITNQLSYGSRTWGHVTAGVKSNWISYKMIANAESREVMNQRPALWFFTEDFYHPKSTNLQPVGQDQYTRIHYDLIHPAAGWDTIRYAYGKDHILPTEQEWPDGRQRFFSVAPIKAASPEVPHTIYHPDSLESMIADWGAERDNLLQAALKNLAVREGGKVTEPFDFERDLVVNSGTPRDIVTGRPSQTDLPAFLDWLNGLREDVE